MKRILLVLLLILPATVEGAVSRVGSWTTGLTHTVGSGNNRLLVFAVGYENGGWSDPGVSSVTYGGQPLTRIGGIAAAFSRPKRPRGESRL